jgi:type I restriction enzyme M protein
MFEQAFKNIDDILYRDAGCTSELDYTEQSSWLLFLKYLDALEADKATEAALDGKKYTHILDKPYRWATWAAPKGPDGKIDHNTALGGDDLIAFVNDKQLQWKEIIPLYSDPNPYKRYGFLRNNGCFKNSLDQLP